MATPRGSSFIAGGGPAISAPDRPESYGAFLEFLFGRKAAGVKLGLDNTLRMLERLGHPEAAFTALHVAGTNGKGSTSAILESVLRTAGYRTGLYTSPHLLDYRERIRIGGRPVSREDLLEAAERVLPHLDEIPLTFFEITTVLGFLLFEAKGVEIGIVEVGLGGRLDATNVLADTFPVITDIHFDHERILGRRLAKIASEKAGIIRGPRTVVTGIRRRAVLGVLEDRCHRAGAALAVLRDTTRWKVRDLTWRGSRFRLATPEHKYGDLFLPLPGEHQVANAALAVRALEVLGRSTRFAVDPDEVEEGLARVRWPGRFQVIPRGPLVVVDAAHNRSGAKALAAVLGRVFPERDRILVLGMLREKDHRRVLRHLAPLARGIIVTSPAHERGAPAEVLARAAEEAGIRAQVVTGVAAAVEAGIRAAGDEGVVCVAGSCYTVGEALEALGIDDPFDG